MRWSQRNNLSSLRYHQHTAEIFQRCWVAADMFHWSAHQLIQMHFVSRALGLRDVCPVEVNLCSLPCVFVPSGVLVSSHTRTQVTSELEMVVYFFFSFLLFLFCFCFFCIEQHFFYQNRTGHACRSLFSKLVFLGDWKKSGWEVRTWSLRVQSRSFVANTTAECIQQQKRCFPAHAGCKFVFLRPKA